MNAVAAWFAPAVEALLVASGRAQVGKLGWTIFHGHRAQVLVACDEYGPLGVVRKWQSRGVGEHELGMLQALASSEPLAVVLTLPRHVGSWSRGSAVFSAQTWLSGAPLDNAVRDRGAAAVERTIGAMADWFEARIVTRTPTPAFPNFLGDEILGRLGRRTPGGAAEQAFVAFTQQTAGLQAECGVLHNDLHMGNLLFDESGGVSGVLDWEHAGPGPLLCDWFGFVDEYALWQAGERSGVGATSRALSSAWRSASPLSKVVRAQTRRLARVSRATPAALDACFQLASFRFSYARNHDESGAAQAVVARSLELKLPAL
jgi:Ser/Thr protein kinase RdoA (MazF antagonist)